MKKKEEIQDETEEVLFDLDDEESSSEESEDNLEDEGTELSLIGSENLRSNVMTGGIVAILLAIGVLFSKKLLGKKQNVVEGDSNYDPVNFEF